MTVEKRIILILLIVIGGVVLTNVQDGLFNKQMSKYKYISYEQELNKVVVSAQYIDKWYVINDSFTCYAI